MTPEERTLDIADRAAQDLVESEGVKTAGIDEYAFEADQLAADEHLDHCIEHLCWRGLARRVEVEAEKGRIIVVALHE
jgi:hypothetical protein